MFFGGFDSSGRLLIVFCWFFVVLWVPSCLWSFFRTLVHSWWFFKVFGGSWWFFEVFGGSWHFLMVFGGSWLFLVVLMVYLWFFVVFGDS